MIRRLALLGLLAFTPLAARAEDPLHLRFSSGPKELKRARKALDKWLRAHAKREFPAKTRAISLNQAISRAQLGLLDMRDAVAAQKSPAPERSAKAPPEAPCSSLESCPSRIGAVHAEGVSGLSEAIVAVVQPWLLLQHRRGGGVSLRTDAGDPGTLATITLDGLVAMPVDICVSPAPMGGSQVWLRSAADLDDIYAFSREEVLHPSRPQ